jgi:hypothetical protein
MTEIKTLKPMWADGKIVEPGHVLSLPDADAAYLISIQRAERVTADAPPKGPAKPAKAKKAE